MEKSENNDKWNHSVFGIHRIVDPVTANSFTQCPRRQTWMGIENLIFHLFNELRPLSTYFKGRRRFSGRKGLSIFNYIVSSRCQSCCRHKSYKVSIFRPLLWCVFGPLFIIYIPALSMFSQSFYWLFRNAFLPHFHSLAPQSPCRRCSATLIDLML